MKRLVFKATAVVLGLGMALLAAELILRVLVPNRLRSFGGEREFFCRFDPQIGWVPLENVTARHRKAGLVALVHQNRFGLRGPDDMVERRHDGKRRVAVFGDSYTWGFGVSQHELFSAPEVHGADVEILNFGVSGYGTDQEYLLYALQRTNFAVDEVVVALTPYNDVANNLSPKQYGHFKPYFTLEGNALVLHTNHVRQILSHSLSRGLSRHCRVWNLLGEMSSVVKQTFNRHRRESNTAEPQAREYRASDITESDRRGIELTVAILKRFQTAAAARQARFSVVFIPYKPHIDKRLPANHPLVPLIAAGLAREGINYREPYPAFLAAAEAGQNPFNDPDNHFGSKGHALFAKFLTQTDLAAAALNYYTRP